MAAVAGSSSSTTSSGPSRTLGLAHQDAEKITRNIAQFAAIIFAGLLGATAIAAVGVATGGLAAIPLWLLIATNLTGAVALGAAIISQVAFSRMPGKPQTLAASQDGEVGSSAYDRVPDTLACCCFAIL